MWGILSKVFLVVIVILAIPTTLILASQNANPGETIYPVKRGMEGALDKIFSINPVTAAYFKTDLSNRRFKEAVTVLKRDDVDKTQANASLVELLSTTAMASADINKVSDPTLKKKLATDLSNQITIYRQNLNQVAKETKQKSVAPVTPLPTSEPTIQPTVQPTISPGPTKIPTPTPGIIQPTPVSPSPTPTPAQCRETPRDFSRCQGTHLLLISEYTNTCTNAKRTVVSSDWNLNMDCDPQLIGQCSSSNLPACESVLAEIQRRLAAISQSANPGSGAASVSNSASTPTPTATPTQTPNPTSSPTPQANHQSAFSILMEREESSSSSSPPAQLVP